MNVAVNIHFTRMKTTQVHAGQVMKANDFYNHRKIHPNVILKHKNLAVIEQPLPRHMDSEWER